MKKLKVEEKVERKIKQWVLTESGGCRQRAGDVDKRALSVSTGESSQGVPMQIEERYR